MKPIMETVAGILIIIVMFLPAVLLWTSWIQNSVAKVFVTILIAFTASMAIYLSEEVQYLEWIVEVWYEYYTVLGTQGLCLLHSEKKEEIADCIFNTMLSIDELNDKYPALHIKQ